MAAFEADAARDVLVRDIDRALVNLDNAPPPACPAHDSLKTGLRVLLECQRAQLTQPKAALIGWAVGAGSVAGGAIVGIAQALQAFAN
jgi:hypothetical protein